MQQGTIIVKTASGQQIQVNRQTQLQLQAQLLQQQQQQQLAGGGFTQQTVAMLGRSVTPNSVGGTSNITFASPSVSQTLNHIKSASPGPSMNLVQVPTHIQQQPQHPQQQQQQFQLAPGAILQLPTSLGTVTQTLGGLVQGQTLIGTQNQNATNPIIQHSNLLNVAPQQMIFNNQTQQRSNINLANIQTATHSPFNIQGQYTGIADIFELLETFHN